MFISFLQIALLMIIFFQDFRTRMISVILPVALFLIGVSNLIYDYWHSNRVDLLIITGINICFIGIILLSLNVYIKIRYGNRAKLLERFGAGDVILLFAITPLVSLETILIIVVIAALIGIGHFILMGRKTAPKNRLQIKIPFASWLSLVTIGSIILKLSAI